jgi:cold-inducible RNA-binding protein
LSTTGRPTQSKRQREQDQKDRAKMREVRRMERRERAAARAASGEVGPPMGEAPEPLGDIEPLPPAAPVQDRPVASAKLYVGNLSFDTTEEDVRELFAEHGTVTDVYVVMDRDTGRPRGFAFVTMGSGADAGKAMRALDGQDLHGRTLRINEAEDRRPSGGGGGRPRR